MTDQLYTQADLRAEAARQHRTLTEDPDYMGVGERMQGTAVPGAVPPGWENTPLHWDELLTEDEFETAQKAVADLIENAADLSEWAVAAGVEGMEPDPDVIDDDPCGPKFRVHLAFAPDVTPGDRRKIADRLAQLAHDLA